MRHVVAVLVLPAASALDIAVPVELFDVHAAAALPYELRICAVEPGSTLVVGRFAVEATSGLDGIFSAGTLLVPAADPATRQPVAVLQALRHAHLRGVRIVGAGTGAFALAQAGLLRGRRATTHWLHADELARRHPDVEVDPSTLYTGDGRVITAAGGAATLDACLDLIRADHGTAAANAIARRMLTPPHRTGDRPQFVAAQLPEPDDDISRLLDWTLARLDQPLSLADLARQANMSQRTLARRFRAQLGTTPLQWLLGKRIEMVRQLLETTSEPIERIARRCGLGSTGNLRQQFVRATGTAPLAYRRTFRASATTR
ncbi:GlxA family transcriptional regulator [Pseudonocardia sp. TRM90224]|uniref:GlxA family transcriptional regulator n=1 Tax=Pseudonocardia sp. TRM90224 TaxID=2812678 RepID=UPI001E5FA63B|nr:helix-turn-helix domain-containing protein [Pseudonocardia sp. TRM90224]